MQFYVKRAIVEISFILGSGNTTYTKNKTINLVQFILFAFINYSTKLHIVIIHLAGSPGSCLFKP